MTTDLQIVADAKADGFMDCLAMRNALGWDKPKANGNPYSSMGVAYRWLREAGEETVYLIPDGYTDVPKTKRTGCYPDVFARVLAYKEAYYGQAAAHRVALRDARGRARPGAGRRDHQEYELGRVHRRPGAGAGVHPERAGSR